MSLAVDVALDGVRAPLSRARVKTIAQRVLRAEGVRQAMLSITFIDRRAIARLNAGHLGVRGATDVIAFGFERSGADAPVVGDVYIAPEVAREHARQRSHGVRTEVARLVIHGVLHVLGHDHPADDGRESSVMWRRQEALLRSAQRAGAA
ncbi:MAG TPA: rRNA maturation RNase YbeY [Gemmatimonadaceae bacterium]|nr:rRNA maturation RNase YbeY [Gemmatimonadaceae bacterium]